MVDDRLTALAVVDGGFRASIGKRTSTASTGIIATGANDNLPPIPGLAEHWGRGVFTCPYCDGFEHSGTHLAVTGSALFVPHIAPLLTGWSDHVTVFHDGLDETVRADLVTHGVNVEERPIAGVQGDGNTVSSLELADGTDVHIGALFVAELPVPNNQLAAELGCAVDEHGYVGVDAMKRTTVPDVWAIGDVTSMRSNMSMAITDGVIAAVDLNTPSWNGLWWAVVGPSRPRVLGPPLCAHGVGSRVQPPSPARNGCAPGTPASSSRLSCPASSRPSWSGPWSFVSVDRSAP